MVLATQERGASRPAISYMITRFILLNLFGDEMDLMSPNILYSSAYTSRLILQRIVSEVPITGPRNHEEASWHFRYDSLN
jgi:hypothetical protein